MLMIKFNNKINIEIFIQNIQEQIKEKVTNIIINDIQIAIGEDFGWSLSVDDRVPQKNIAEIKEREKLASAYEKQGNMHMAAMELEECAVETLWNCLNTTLNISNDNVKTICSFLERSRKCWSEFSGKYILPSQSKSY